MMKKLFLLAAFSFVAVSYVSAQQWVSTQNNNLVVYPDTTKVGIGTGIPTEKLHLVEGAIRLGRKQTTFPHHQIPLFWTDPCIKFGNDENIKIGLWGSFTTTTLSFKAPKFYFETGSVGIGTSSPQYKLDVNGKLFLRTVSAENGWGQSFLQWPGHKLIMGSPVGNYMHVSVDLKPGGASDGPLFSQFLMYTALGENQYEERIKLNTIENCWLNNTGYVGIGTTNPQYKLDVNGTLRANEIIVSIPSGADYVFDSNYTLRPLSEVRKYITAHHHLPEIPSAEEMKANGVSMNELQIRLLQKIEELTLYILQQEQRINELEQQVK